MNNHTSVSTQPEEQKNSDNGNSQSYKVFDKGVKRSDLNLTPELFEEFKKAAFSYQPNLKKLYEEIGNVVFYSYTKSHIRENRNKTVRARKPEFISVVKEEVRRVLGSEVAESVAKQLKTNDSISTVQHHAPIGHPDTLNACLANALPYFGSNNPEHQNVLVFACAGVSFNNSKFPRGHLFHTVKSEGVQTEQLTFFGHTVDPRPVMYNFPFDYEDIVEIKQFIDKSKREGGIDEDIHQKLISIVDNIYRDPHPLSLNDYVDQLTITNYKLFKEIFRNYKKHVPNLIFLSQEKIALKLILEYHLKEKTSIYKMLFDPLVLDLVEKHFEGITGAFSKKKSEGSFLFWGMPEGSKLRVQLWRNGNFLEAKDGSYRIELTPKNIRQAILERKLIPSVMLTFSILACYYGNILGGGHFQTEYLTQMKAAYISVMEKSGDLESLEAVQNLVTDNFVIPRPTLVYLKYNDDRIPATGLDMILYGNNGLNWQEIIEGSKNVKVSQLIERMLPELLKAESANLSNPQLLKITERDIEVFNGLDKKIPEISALVTP